MGRTKHEPKLGKTNNNKTITHKVTAGENVRRYAGDEELGRKIRVWRRDDHKTQNDTGYTDEPTRSTD